MTSSPPLHEAKPRSTIGVAHGPLMTLPPPSAGPPVLTASNSGRSGVAGRNCGLTRAPGRYSGMTEKNDTPSPATTNVLVGPTTYVLIVSTSPATNDLVTAAKALHQLAYMGAV